MPQGRYQIVLSGVALVFFQGNTPQDWLRNTYELVIRADRAIGLLQLPPPPAGRYNALHLEQWVVYAGLNAVFNGNLSNNAGYAVDRFYLPAGQAGGDIVSDVIVAVDLAARDNDGQVIRVGYYFMAIGSLVTRPIPG